MALPTAILRAAFKKACEPYLWDPRLLEAQAMVESSGHAEAFRFEAARADGSFGLLQVLGNTARKLGLPTNQSEASLCDPYIGMEYGLRALRDIVKWVDCDAEWAQGKFKNVSLPLPVNLRTVLARFNGGGAGNPDNDGALRSDAYVRKVEAFFAQVVAEAAA